MPTVNTFRDTIRGIAVVAVERGTESPALEIEVERESCFYFGSAKGPLRSMPSTVSKEDKVGSGF